MSITNLKNYCKAFKVKQPKEPYFLMSEELMRARNEVLKYLHKQIDKGGGNIIVKLPMNNSDCRLFIENDQYYFSSGKFGNHNLNDLSTDFLGEQFYYSIETASSGWSPSKYEEQFDNMKGIQEEWMHVIIANKEKRVTLQTGVSLQYSGYCPEEMCPGTIIAVYEQDEEFYVCVEGQDDICWEDLNIDTKVTLCDELYNEFLPQVTPRTIEEVLTMIALECKSKFDRMTLSSNAKTPANVLSILSGDKDELVRQRVAINKNAPTEILTKLADDSSSNVRKTVAENIKTPAPCLAKLATAKQVVIDFGRERDLCEDVRLAVARHPNTPKETLIELAKDTSVRVSRAASEHLVAPSLYDAGRIDNEKVSKDVPDKDKESEKPTQALMESAAIACYYPKDFPLGQYILALLDRI